MPLAMNQVDAVNPSLSQLDQAAGASDQTAIQNAANSLSRETEALHRLHVVPVAIVWSHAKTKVRENLRDTEAALTDVRDAAAANDHEKLKAALVKFHAAYDPVREEAAEGVAKLVK
jgi:non-ribosomal peptide synthetase component E (peptide arylation enzyme)